MTFEAYINPDFGLKEKLVFLLMAFLGIVICIAVIIIYAGLSSSSYKKEERKIEFYDRAHIHIQKFYELIISGTSVMSFSCAYVIINHIYSQIQGGVPSPGTFITILMSLWGEGRDFMLLLLICLSCVLNTILDRIFIPLKHLTRGEKASVRMLAMFYVIIILIVLNMIGDENEYNPVMMYYLGLMVGRFVYFDASFHDFLEAMKNIFKNLPLLVMGLFLSGGLCLFGFEASYLLERNYYIVGAFYTHLFMLTVIFLLYHTHIMDLLIRKPEGYDDYYPEDDEYYDDHIDEDDEEYYDPDDEDGYEYDPDEYDN
ncbi:MAG: hypothetical protein K6B28_11800 [Lachnospiraceae bacterium]|nr:hypothetical protein [Lachnospiraceae bacterium]